MKSSTGWIVALGILALGLVLAGCTATQDSAEWKDEVGALGAAIAKVQNAVFANAEAIQQIQMQIEEVSEGNAAASTAGEPSEDTERLNDELTTLRETLEALSARVDEIETAISQRPQSSEGLPPGRP